MKWIDVTVPLKPDIAVWPGDDPYTFKPKARVADGASCNVSRITMTTHCGTHVDAPWHFEDDGAKLEEVDTDLFFGQATVIEVPEADHVSAADLGDAKLPPRVLLKTRNSTEANYEEFKKDYVALTEDAATRLVDEGVRLIGVDYASVAPYGNTGPVHHILLRAGVFVVEGLRLASIPAGAHEFVVLPLALSGADGGPARAFVGMT